MKNRKKLFKRITIGSLSAIGTGATLFSVISTTVEKKTQHSVDIQSSLFNSQDSLSRSRRDTTPVLQDDKNVVIAPIDSSQIKHDHSPENLYLLNSLYLHATNGNAGINYSNAAALAIRFIEGFQKFKYDDDNLFKSLFAQQGLLSSAAIDDAYAINHPEVVSPAMRYFESRDEMLDIFNKVNGFGSESETVELSKPKNIYFINQAWESKVHNYIDDLSSKVEYKVAEINYNNPSSEGNFAKFNIKLKEHDTSLDQDKYLIDTNLIIKDDPATAAKIEASITGNANPLDDLIDNGDILFRDQKAVKPFATRGDCPDFLSMDYNADTKILSIYIKPPTSTKQNTTQSVVFKKPNDNTAGNVDVGLRDMSLSTAHLFDPNVQSNDSDKTVGGYFKADATSFAWQEAAPFKLSGPNEVANISRLKRYSMSEEQGSDADEVFKFWLGHEESVQLALKPTDENQKFDSSGGTVSLSYKGDFVKLDKTDLFFDKVSVGATNSNAITINYSKTTDERFAKIIVKLNSNFKFSAPIIIANTKPTKSLFFNDLPPGYFTNAIPFSDSGNISVNANVKPDSGELYQKYIKNTFADWTFGNDDDRDAWKIHTSGNTNLDHIRRFAFDHDYYYKSDGTVKSGGTKSSLMTKNGFTDSEIKTLLLQYDEMGVAIENNDQLVTINSSGKNIMDLFGTLMDRRIRWALEDFNYHSGNKTEGFYTANDETEAINVLDRLEQLDPNGKEQLESDTKHLIEYVYGSDMTDGYKEYIDELLEQGSERNTNVRNIIKAYYQDNHLTLPTDWTIKDILIGTNPQERNIHTSPGDETGKIFDYTTDNAIIVNRIMHYIIELDIAKIVQNAIKSEDKWFESIYRSLIKDSIAKYLDGTINGTFNSIKNDALLNIQDNKVSDDFKDAGLIAMGKNPVGVVHTGREQLKSLLDFIYNYRFEKKFLNNGEIEIFDDFYKSGRLLDSKNYSGDDNLNEITNMIGILDSIIKKMSVGNAGGSLKDIVDDIIHHKLSSDKGAQRIVELLNPLIKHITNTEKTIEYNIFGRIYKTTYLEKLVIGRNLTIILQTWISKHLTPSSSVRKAHIQSNDAKLNELAQKGLYDPKTIILFAINLGYYNFDYFIEHLTKVNLIPSESSSILGENLMTTVTFEIPNTDSTVLNLISDSVDLIKYTMVIAGVMMIIIGLMGLFTRAIKGNKIDNKSLKTKVFINGALMITVLIGCSLIGLGFLGLTI